MGITFFLLKRNGCAIVLLPNDLNIGRQKMAYMNQDKKAKIAAQLKTFMPKDWKWSLSVEHHSAIILTIASAPIDLIAENRRVFESTRPMNAFNGPRDSTHIDVNLHYLEREFDGELLLLFQKMKEALNIDNWDRSDIQSDYFDVGHYSRLKIGRWDKPFNFTGKPQEKITIAA